VGGGKLEVPVALPIKKTSSYLNNPYINCVIYGQSGVGKTFLASTAPKPLVLAAEDGLLSLANFNIDYVEIRSINDLAKVYEELAKGDHDYQTVYFDSLSEVAEVVLAARKKEERDPRRAYGDMAENLVAVVRKFKSLPMHVVFIAKQTRIEDELTGKQMFGPAFPGKVLPANMPYLVDMVFAMRIGKHEGKEYRYLQTFPDIQYEAKDRSGILSAKERPNLSAIFDKIQANLKGETDNGSAE